MVEQASPPDPGDVWRRYRRSWRQLFWRSLALYLPLAVIAVLIESANEHVGLFFAAGFLLFGVYWLQAIHAAEAAHLFHAPSERAPPSALGQVRERIGTLSGALPLMLLALLPFFLVAWLILYLAIKGSDVGSGRFALALVWSVLTLSIGAAVWSLVAPIIMVEGLNAFRAVTRSVSLALNNPRELGGMAVLSTAFAFCVFFLIRAIFRGALAGPNEVADFITDVLADSLTAPVIAIVWTHAYFEFRTPKAPVNSGTPRSA